MSNKRCPLISIGLKNLIKTDNYDAIKCDVWEDRGYELPALSYLIPPVSASSVWGSKVSKLIAIYEHLIFAQYIIQFSRTS